ncbi:MAG: hypothetical protein ACYSSK_05065 [Planctomycetota bacterium]
MKKTWPPLGTRPSRSHKNICGRDARVPILGLAEAADVVATGRKPVDSEYPNIPELAQRAA